MIRWGSGVGIAFLLLASAWARQPIAQRATASGDAKQNAASAPVALQVAWSTALGNAPLTAFAALPGTGVVVVAATDDKPETTTQRLLLYPCAPAKSSGQFGAPLPLREPFTATRDTPLSTLLALPASPESPTILFAEAGARSLHRLVFDKNGAVAHTVDLATSAVPLAVVPGTEPLRVVLQGQETLEVAEQGSEADATKLAPVRAVRVGLRVAPASAACVADFDGDKREDVAALGSGGNGPVAFGKLRGRNVLPDTGDEYAPGLIAAWRMPGHPLPFLVTARNTGAEEGTDTPEGRVVLSLWSASDDRWIPVWTSAPLGTHIVAMVVGDPSGEGTDRLLVVYRDATRTYRLTALAATSE